MSVISHPPIKDWEGDGQATNMRSRVQNKRTAYPFLVSITPVVLPTVVQTTAAPPAVTHTADISDGF
jgi:hypothetical protein